jgi:GR25 family glycosyltransferase involved in LPS biosynthesis
MEFPPSFIIPINSDIISLPRENNISSTLFELCLPVSNLYFLPDDFNCNNYKFLYDDLQNINDDEELKNHYIQIGYYENRIYKINLPEDFNANNYKYLNIDLQHMNENELKNHYINIGYYENRIYKINLPKDFNFSIYKKLNIDLAHMNENELKNHYIQIGYYEDRIYKINLPKDFNANNYKYLNNNLDHINENKLNHHRYKEERKYKISLPDDFDSDHYKFLNNDLIDMNYDQLKIHYINYGCYENRIYKINLPGDFIPNNYKYLNNNLEHMNENELKIHYINIGYYENLIYKINLPEDFIPNNYKYLNNDLQNINDVEYFKYHYINHGFYEDRIYKINLPEDFDENTYKKINIDLEHMNENELINHYINYGYFENRIYKIDLPKDFDENIYKKLNYDLDYMNENELINHYINYGYFEKRIYKIDLPEDFDENTYKKLNYDLKNMNENELINHYINYGYFENRIYKNNKYITMINIGIYGRLGNQLFQYALLYKLSLLYKINIKLPIYDENFICHENTNDKKKTKIHKYFDLKYEILDNFNLDDYYNINETNFSYSSKFLNLHNENKNININGYFQSYKYFNDIKDDIINIFKFKNDIFTTAKNYIYNIKNNNLPIVGIHIRRGDLINYTGYGPPININYIINAINYIKSKINDFIILVLSDDISWVKNNLNVSNNIYYSRFDEITDLCLLTLCNHLILSNSSFSWWGAYLNTNPNKIVIIKSINNQDYFFDYVVPINERCDLIPPDWIQLDDDKNINIENVIYSTIYNRGKNLTIKKLNLIKELVICNKDYIKDKYDYGIVIPTYNRPDYLKYTLQALIISNINLFNIIFIIFDDGSEDKNTLELINKFNLKNIPIIKIYSNRYNLLQKNDLHNTIIAGSCYPYSIKFSYDILFRLNCKYVINLDSDAMVCYDWLIILNNFINKINDEYFILSGFKNDGTTHKIKEEYNDHYILNGFGGINIIFNKKTFYDIIYEQIYDTAYDWYIMEVVKSKNIKIYSLKPSIVQHIGFNTSIIRGIENVENYKLNNTTYEEITNIKLNNDIDINLYNIDKNILLELDNKSKNIENFPHSNDYKLIRNETFLDKIIDKIFIINLDDRKDRLNNIIKHLYNINITDIERFNAIKPRINNNCSQDDINNFIKTQNTDINFLLDFDIKTYSNISFEWFRSSNPTIKYIQGMIGCKASHVEIVKIAKDRNYKYILILEDDIEFILNWEYHLKNSINSLNENNIDFDMLYFTNNHSKKYDQITDFIVKPTYGLQTGGYILKNSLFDYIIDNAFNSGREIDNFYAENIQNNTTYNFNVYGICPNIINQIENYSSIENKNVNYSNNTIMHTVRKYDIVYVCHSKDKESLIKSLNSINRYVHHYRNIYLVSKENYLIDYCDKYNIIFINENIYPFSKNDIKNYLPNECPQFKYGWFYQQLLKLYIYKVIPDITENYVVIDSDIIFLDFFSFFDNDNKPYFTTGDEYNIPYFEHMSKLYINLEKQINKSGISHHMVFNKYLIDKMINEIELMHNDLFWKKFLELVTFDNTENYSRASEYELYFNYILKYYKEKYNIRTVEWKNHDSSEELINDKNYKFIAIHDYFINSDKTYVIE